MNTNLGDRTPELSQ